jgi:hypothetical protein
MGSDWGPVKKIKNKKRIAGKKIKNSEVNKTLITGKNKNRFLAFSQTEIP